MIPHIHVSKTNNIAFGVLVTAIPETVAEPEDERLIIDDGRPWISVPEGALVVKGFVVFVIVSEAAELVAKGPLVAVP